jgi:hypothetical protein
MVLCGFHSVVPRRSAEDCDLPWTDWLPSCFAGSDALRDVISATLSGMQGPRHVTATALALTHHACGSVVKQHQRRFQ